MVDLSTVFERNRAWARDLADCRPERLSGMAGGQAPTLMYLGCSDSRVPPESIMGLEPGDVFVVRNVANLAPRDDPSVATAVTFAVTVLGVTDLVVCGHYGCGGIEASMVDDGSFEPWLSTVRDVRRRHVGELAVIHDEAARQRRLVELNALAQCSALQDRLPTADGELRLHAWVFDVATGLLRDLGFTSAESGGAGGR
jgi:carbonic anhydrase